MSFVNKKIFGSDIDSKIKQKLELLQLAAGNSVPNELTEGKEFSTSRYVKAGEPAYKIEDLLPVPEALSTSKQFLSQRTPFARMWTSLMLSKHVKTDVNDVGVSDTYEEVQSNLIAAGITELNELEFIGKISEDGADFGRYAVLKSTSLTDDKVYTIGTHNLSQISGYDADPISPSEYISSDGAISDFDKYGSVLFKDELSNNPFLKPQSGILQVSSETEGALGAVKRTNVSFVVHNFEDFDKIYSKYFLRPGAQIFLDFGWSTSKLYNPVDIINPAKRAQLPAPHNTQDVGEILYGDEGFIAKNIGDMEIINGFVTNYDAKIRENGSVECSVEITSRNEALFENKFSEEDAIRERLAYSLDKEIMRFVMTFYAKQDALGELSEASKNVLLNGDWTAAGDTQAQLEDAWNYFAQGKGDSKKSITDSEEFRNTPNDSALEVGVYFAGDEPDDKNLYVTMGFFEDKILNKEFSFGDDLDNDPLQEAERLEPRFDSRNSLILKHSHLFQRQTRLSKTKITKATPIIFPPTLYPEGKFDSENGDKPLKKTYDSERGKLPKVPFATRAKGSGEEIIPFRDIFIQVDLIKSAIKDSSNIQEMMDFVIKKLKKATGKIYDFQVGSKYDNTTSSFIDNNYFYAQDNAVDSGEKFYDTLFIFNPHSKDSIVKNMDMSFEMPKDGLSSMVAITNAGPGGNVLNSNDLTDIALKQKSIDQLQGVGVEYLPKMGNHAVLNQEQDLDGLMTNYAEGDSVFGDTYDSNDPQGDYKEFAQYAEKQNWGYQDTVDDIKHTNDAEEDFKILWGDYDPKDDVEREKNVSKKIMTKDAVKWFEMMVGITSSKRKPTSTIMPMKLSLTIHGFSSLQPGDLFRVDYLPKRYQKKVFFQIVGISHELSTSTWSTTIETVMRMRPETPDVPQDITPDYVIVDKRSLKKSEKMDKQSGTKKNLMDSSMIDLMMPRIKELKPVMSVGKYGKDCQVYEFLGHRHGSSNTEGAPGGPNSPSGIALSKTKNFYSARFQNTIHNVVERSFQFRDWEDKAKISTEKKFKQISKKSKPKQSGWTVSLPALSSDSLELANECDFYKTPQHCDLNTQPRFLNTVYTTTKASHDGGKIGYSKGDFDFGQSQKVPTCWFGNALSIIPMRWVAASRVNPALTRTHVFLMGQMKFDGDNYEYYQTGQPIATMFEGGGSHNSIAKYQTMESTESDDYHKVRGAIYNDQSSFFDPYNKQPVFAGELQYHWNCSIFQDWKYRLMIYKNLFIVWPIALSDGSSTYLGGGDESYAFMLRKCYNIGFQTTKIPVQNYSGNADWDAKEAKFGTWTKTSDY